MTENKLLEFQKRGLSVAKDTTNPFHRNKYPSLPNVLETIIPVLNELGLTTNFICADGNLVLNVNDGETNYQSSLPLPTDVNSQQLTAAITYFRRALLISFFNLPAVDLDGNDAVGIEANEVPVKKELPWLNKISDINKEDYPTIDHVYADYRVNRVMKGELVKYYGSEA